jgi:hypothetical protein
MKSYIVQIPKTTEPNRIRFTSASMQSCNLLNTTNSIVFRATNSHPEWKVYLFGSKPGEFAMVFEPVTIPNAFIRFMSKVFLGCTWVKQKCP